MSEKVGIRPDVGVLGVLRNLNYQPWYALAEYVDNSIDSYLKNKEALLAIEGPDYRLYVEIEIDSTGKEIRILDNAAGIAAGDIGRALQVASPPPNRQGLSEFGMGMKAASCWFSPLWSIKTKALGEGVARVIKFDVDHIISSNIQELDVERRIMPATEHFTAIKLSRVANPPHKRTLTKIKSHLASIYRGFILSGDLVLTVNGDVLAYEMPEVLEAPLYSKSKGESVRWWQEVSFECGKGKSVRGFAAIRETGSTAEAGFSLFRRGRVIVGSHEEVYRPEAIFGRGNSYRSQRLFGEFHLEGFGVSHTKDGFQWDGCEEEFLELVEKALSNPAKPLLKQIDNYRKNAEKAGTAKKMEPSNASSGAQTKSVTTSSSYTLDFGQQGNNGNPQPKRESGVGNSTSNGSFTTSASPTNEVVRLKYNEAYWQVHIELSTSFAHHDWLEIGDHLIPKNAKATGGERLLGVRVAMTNPFLKQLAVSDATGSNTLTKLIASLAVARTLAMDGGATQTGLFLDFLGEVLAQPTL